MGDLVPNPGREVLYLSLVAAVAAGALLRVRLRPGEVGTSLWPLPAVVAHAVLGLGVVGAASFGALLAVLVRPGAGALALVVTVATAFVASLVAGIVAGVSGAAEPIRSILFALVLGASVAALQRVCVWRSLPCEQPALVLWLVLAPLAAIPLVAGSALGNGALLLALAGLLALLFVVREAVNLGTARAEAEAESVRLARATELQDELINLVTHELRNPLTTVRAYAQLAARSVAEGKTDKLSQQLANIERGAAAIERLVDNLLELSRLEGRGALPPAEPVDPVSLVRAVVNNLAPLAEQKNLPLSFEAAGSVPMAMVPPDLLREALSNLVSNAIKYTPPTGRVTVAVHPAENALVAFSVADTGVGLSEEDQRRLFTKFFRSENPEVRAQRGSGLGLALTHAITLRMGGRIEVESVLGEGTRFRLLVPAQEAVEATPNPVEVPA